MTTMATTARAASSLLLTLLAGGSIAAPRGARTAVAAFSLHARASVRSTGPGRSGEFRRASCSAALASAYGSNVEGEGGSVYTEADVTETIRVQSLHQMDRISDHYSSLSQASAAGTHYLPTLLSTPEEAAQYVDENVDAILFDCDGVLYRGTDTIPDAAECLSDLTSRRGKKVFFVTNNAGSNREQLREKLATLLHSDELEVEQMVSSSYSAARYLQRELLGGISAGSKLEGSQRPNVHVIGTSGLCGEIRKAGFHVRGGPSDDPRAGMTRDELASYPFPDDMPVDAVVVGLDDEFNYRKLCVANVLLQRNPDALFVATNTDAYDLVGADARHLPGNGALVRALEHASQRTAVNVGKPSPLLAELIADDHGLDPSRTLFVGDRLDTDVRFGLESGMMSALVLTGCTTAAKVVELSKVRGGRGTVEEPMPTIVLPHMGMLSIDANDAGKMR